MNEQQRLILTVVLCLGIMLGWQLILGPPPPPPGVGAGPTKGEGARSAGVVPGDRNVPGGAGGSAREDDGHLDASGAGESAGLERVVIPEQTESFVTDVLRGRLSNRGAALQEIQLLRYDERDSEGAGKVAVSLAPPMAEGGGAGQAQVVVKVNGAVVDGYTLGRGSAGDFLLSSREGVGARAQIAVKPRRGEYALDYTVGIDNPGPAASVEVAVQLVLDWKKGTGSTFAPPTDQLFGACGLPDGVERKAPEELMEDGAFEGPVPAFWGGLDRQYFVVAVSPQGEALGSCVARANAGFLSVDYRFPAVQVSGHWEQSFAVYVGPKRGDHLKAISPALADVIEYDIWGIPLGALARPMVALMNVFHGWTGSWGVAIMLLTLVVKLLLFPVTYKSVVSMRKMQLLKPELDKLKERFPNDRERQQMEQLKLFREKGVNPLGGCLPMLLQMPVWFALYRTLWTAVDLYQQPFLWLPDLTAKEPFPILALLLGALTYVQQRVTPMATDSQQAKVMMYMMPIMLTVFMIALPSGLVLYILVNSVLTIVQQLAINRRQIAL